MKKCPFCKSYIVPIKKMWNYVCPKCGHCWRKGKED